MRIASKKIVIGLIMLMVSLNVLGCSSESSAARIAEAKRAGAAQAEASWGAKKVEVTAGDPNNLSSSIGKDTKKNQDLADAKREVAEAEAETNEDGVVKEATFIIDRRTGLYHKNTCPEVENIRQVNKELFYSSSDDAKAEGWQSCTVCKPYK